MQVIVLKHIVFKAYLFCCLVKDTMCTIVEKKNFCKKN